MSLRIAEILKEILLVADKINRNPDERYSFGITYYNCMEIDITKVDKENDYAVQTYFNSAYCVGDNREEQIYNKLVDCKEELEEIEKELRNNG